MVFPFLYKPLVQKNIAGNSVYGPAISSLCFPNEKSTIVINKDGQEVVSKTALYTRNTEVEDTAQIMYKDKEHNIITIQRFASSKNKAIKLVVIYI